MRENIFTVIFTKPEGMSIEMAVKREGLTPEQAYEYVVSKQRRRVREAIEDGEYIVTIIPDVNNTPV